ncbi:MAG: UDP-galactopyranose mutase [Desulfovibrio sp.]|nr:UDP-galactopyranose mutase [Desulfovibrio sp.]
MTYFIIGSGIWGSVMAERIASVLRVPVVVVERRNHVGGNCHASRDAATGIECHRYGSHIFHTKIREVWDYLTKFTRFNSYRHKVLIRHAGRTYVMPINLATINALYQKNFTPEEAQNLLQEESNRAFPAEARPQNLEEKAVSQIGRPLYEAFIRDYTAKQWGRAPVDLPASIINRLPIRTSYNFDYFDDPWQGIPWDGYAALFARLLDNTLITVRLNTSYEAIKTEIPSDATVIYTGQADALFDCVHGELEWRSLRFEWETVNQRDYQGTSVMNYADADVAYTRIHEFKHYHPERTEIFESGHTVICREYPSAWTSGGEAYYPLNDARNTALYERYAAMAQEAGIILGGRLGAYRYWDMDKAVADALRVFETRIAG